jgi:hypothetical protein
MRGERLVLLVAGCLLIVAAGLLAPGMERGAFILGCSLLGIDLMLAVLGPLLHGLRERLRQKLEESVASASKSVDRAPIPDTVKQRAKDVKRRLGGQTIAATDRRTLLDEERRRRGL